MDEAHVVQFIIVVKVGKKVRCEESLCTRDETYIVLG